MKLTSIPRWKKALGMSIKMLTLGLVLYSENSIAQTPAISSFSDYFGVPGSTVTIVGVNFNSTANQNVVYFGGVRASVVSGGATSLVVNVPNGACYGPITLVDTVSHKAAMSSAMNSPEFDTGCLKTDSIHFQAKVDFSCLGTTSTQPYSVAVGDLDNDGKPDVIVGNQNFRAVSFFRNTSSLGSISSASLAYQTGDSLGTIGDVRNIKLADLDGDGKLDLIVTISNSVYVQLFRNTSTGPGNIRFASPRTVRMSTNTSGPQLYETVVADFDGDGKLDIATVKQGDDSVAVSLNQMTAPPTPRATAAFTGTAFGSYTSYHVGSQPWSLACADLDGDGKPDMVTSDFGGSSISILRNTTSSAGSPSFAAATSLSMPSSLSPFEIQTGDLNKDGKPDLLLAASNLSSNAGSLVVFKNTSSSGTVSFAGSSTFSTSNDLASGISIADLNGDRFPDVVISNNYSSNVAVFKNLSTSSTLNFGLHATLTSGNGPIGLQLADLDGDDVNDLVLANHGSGSSEISVYKNKPSVKSDTISGAYTLCTTGSTTTTYVNSFTGGEWTVTDGTIAAIDPSTGVLVALATGDDTVVYTRICGLDTIVLTHPVSILAGPSSSGVISGPSAVCVSNTITLSETVTGGSWGVTSATSAYASISSTGDVTGTSIGTAQIYYTISNACGSRISYRNVNVTAAAGTISGPTTMCTGVGTALSVSSYGGTWTSSNTAIATVHPSSGVVTGASAGSATITYTAPGGCYATHSVTIITSPVGISGSVSVCLHGTTTLSDATLGGTWSASNPSISTIDPTSGDVTGDAIGADTIYYTVGSCTTFIRFTVNDNPADITGAPSVCAGNNITISDATAPGTWTSSTPSVATVTSTGSAAGLLHGISYGTTTITYTVTGTGCTTTRSFSVDSLPSAITGPAAVCVGSRITLANSSASTGTWSSSTTSVGTVSGVGAVTGVSAGTTNIIYTFSLTGCSVSRTITVNPLPANISGNAPICPRSSETLTNATSGGFWTVGDSTRGRINISTGVFTAIATGTETVTYTLYATGCAKTSTITVKPTPAAIVGSDTICNGVRTTYYESSTGGYFVSSDTFSLKIDSATGAARAVAPGIDTIKYLDTTTNRCSVIFPVYVAPILTPSVTMTLSTGSNDVCDSLEVLYTANPVNGGSAPTYVWTVNGLRTGTGQTFHYFPANGDIVKVVMTSNYRCTSVTTASTQTTMIVHPLVIPTVHLVTSTGSDTVCTGVRTMIVPEMTYSGTSPSFVWQVNGVTVWYGTTWSYYPTDSDIVKVTMTSNVRCPQRTVVSDSFMLRVSDYLTPDVTIIGPDTACTGYPVHYRAVPTNGGMHPTYRWIVNGSVVGTSDTFSYVPFNGDNIACAIESSFPCLTVPSVTCTPKTITVLPVPVPRAWITVDPGWIVDTATWCSFTCHVANVGNNRPIYTWFKNGMPLPRGVWDSLYQSATINDGDSIQCRVTNPDYCDGITCFAYQVMWVGHNLSTQQIADASIRAQLMPNPNNGSFSLHAEFAKLRNEDIQLSVTNVLGQVVYNENVELNSGALDTKLNLGSQLASGVYVLTINSGDAAYKIRFEVQK